MAKQAKKSKKAKKARPQRGFRLSRVKQDKKIETAAYDKRLAAQQLLLRQIQQAYLASGERGIIVFEGWDAAGKGGTIRAWRGTHA